jgi:hypothetical protein
VKSGLGRVFDVPGFTTCYWLSIGFSALKRLTVQLFSGLIRGRVNLLGSSIQFAVFFFLAVFNAGAMTTLQIQHYGIYPYVGRDDFKRYMQANNQAAFIPAVLPGLALFVLSLSLIFSRPPFMTFIEAVGCFLLNLAALISTLIWQRKLQEEMAATGYDDAKIKLLLSTNWIRTCAFLIQAAFVTGLTVHSCGS